MRHFSKHIQHYLPLLGIFVAGFIGLAFFAYDRVFQVAVAISVACAYVAWGVIHHHLHRDLYLAVVIEYLAIAILGLVVIFSLVFNL